MSLATAVRSAVAAVKASTASLQCEVQHRAWIADEDELAAAVPRQALVQEGVKHHELAGGQVVTTKARLYFLEAIAPNGAPGREEPVDPRDEFTLPSGFVGTVVEVPPRALDPEGSPVAGFVSAVWLA